MKAISINPETKTIKEIDIEMQVNTIYTFFGSISIDEFDTIKEHTIYADANAIAKSETPFFIGKQLIIGNALIVGGSSLEEKDSDIPIEDIESLISYDISDFYKQSLLTLSNSNIDIYRPFNVIKQDNEMELNSEWVLYAFNIADDKTKEYFLAELNKYLKSITDTQGFMQKMAQLAVDNL